MTIVKINSCKEFIVPLKHICKIKLDKACFGHVLHILIAKIWIRNIWITISDKNLKERAYEIAINPKNDGYKED